MKTIRAFQERVARIVMNAELAHPERYARRLQAMQAAGYVADPKVSYEGLREFIASGEYSIEIPTTYHAQIEAHGAESLLPALFARNWTVLLSDPATGDFVTCDHPVRLLNTSRDRVSPRVGYGMSETAVLFPVSKHLAVLGEFDVPERTSKLNWLQVAETNWIIAGGAKQQVYSLDCSFCFMPSRGDVRSGPALPDALVAVGQMGTRA